MKAMGSWTRNLLRLAGEADDARPEPKYNDPERGRGPAREVRVIVEGPYSKYQVLAVSGGADTITLVLKAVQDTLFILLILGLFLSLVAVGFHMS